MKLDSLTFRRDYSEPKNLYGEASFEDAHNSKINLRLNPEQAARIMEICQEALAIELTKASEAMRDSLKTSIELRKATKIGRGLPESW